MNITSPPPIRKHRTARLLMVAVAALCTLPMLVMGASPASAATTIPVYDLKTRLAPPDYSRVVVDTSHDINQTDISQIDGFSEQTMPNGGPHIYIPQKTGASLILSNAGYTVEPDGTHKPIQARYTVNDWYYGVLAYEKNGFHAFADPARNGHSTKRTFIDFTVTLMQEGVPLPTSVKGVTGFWDLDGPRDSSTEADATGVVEGVELRSGFDGAYVRSDSHLKQFGDNGFGGAVDQNDDTVNTAHGNQHYLGATFQGNKLTVRHSNTKTSGYGTAFSPVQTLIAYYLHYDRNAADATGDTPTMTEPTNDLSANQTMSGCHVYYPAQANINLATPLKDSDCWDATMLTRPGHTFLGWSRGKNSTTPEHKIIMPKHDQTVYAIWAKDLQFTYEANVPSDYSGAVPQVPDMRELPPGSMVSNVSPWQVGSTGILRGYRFDGWKVARDNASAVYGFDKTPLNVNTTVYAAWTPLTINLHYDPNGGEGSHDSQNTRWDTTVGIPGNVNDSFHRDGFKLTGWNTKPDGTGKSYQPNGKVPMVDKDVTLYAQWEPVVTTMPETGSRTLAWALGGVFAVLLLIAGSAVMLVRIRRKN